MQGKPIIKFLNYIPAWLWWHLPVSKERKEKIKGLVFRQLGFVFWRTKAYSNWRHGLSLSEYKGGEEDADYPAHWPFDPEENRLNAEKCYQKPDNQPLVNALAMVLHVHYPDLLNEVLKMLSQTHSLPVKMYVSATDEVAEKVAVRLKETGLEYKLHSCENRGRDVRLFLYMASLAIEDGYELLLKIYTKRSDYRLTGDLWRRELYRKLLEPRAIENAVSVFNFFGNIGLMGPAGHIVPMKTYYGANAKALGYLSRRMGMSPNEIFDVDFVAGSMFYVRKQALLPLLALKLPLEIFEPEAGQQDGTMAHAVERAFAISTRLAGFKLVDTNFKEGRPAYTRTKEHPFTW